MLQGELAVEQKQSTNIPDEVNHIYASGMGVFYSSVCRRWSYVIVTPAFVRTYCALASVLLNTIHDEPSAYG